MKRKILILIILSIITLGCATTPTSNISSDYYGSTAGTETATTQNSPYLIVKGKFFAATFEGNPPADYKGELANVTVFTPTTQQVNYNQVNMQNYLNPYSQYGYSSPYGTNNYNSLNPYATQQNMAPADPSDPFMGVGAGMVSASLNVSSAGSYYDVKPNDDFDSGKGRIYITGFDAAETENFRLTVNRVSPGQNDLASSPDQMGFPVQAYLRTVDGLLYAAGRDFQGSGGAIQIKSPAKDGFLPFLSSKYKDTTGYFLLTMVFVKNTKVVDTSGTDNTFVDDTGTSDDDWVDPTTDDAAKDTSSQAAVSFETGVRPIFTKLDCASQCHTSSTMAGKLNLQESGLYNILTNPKYVDTANPADSKLLVLLLKGSSISHGGPKPFENNQGQDYITIYNWIAGGLKP